MNCIQYSFENLISGRHYTEESGWVDTPEEYRAEALEKFKEFLLMYARRGCKPHQAISRMSLRNLPENAGIFRRLIIQGESVSYTAGQDYVSEINYIKQSIIKYCY